MEFLATHWVIILVIVAAVANEILQFARKDYDNSVLVRTLELVVWTIRAVLNVVPGVNLDRARKLGFRLDQKKSSLTEHPNFRNLNGLVMPWVLAGVALAVVAGCASVQNRAESSYVGVHAAVELAMNVVDDACVSNEPLTDEQCAAIYREHRDSVKPAMDAWMQALRAAREAGGEGEAGRRYIAAAAEAAQALQSFFKLLQRFGLDVPELEHAANEIRPVQGAAIPGWLSILMMVVQWVLRLWNGLSERRRDEIKDTLGDDLPSIFNDLVHGRQVPEEKIRALTPTEDRLSEVNRRRANLEPPKPPIEI